MRARATASLSAFETEVIGVVRKLQRAAAADVRRELAAQGRDVAYTTVAAALQRLARRKILTRGKEPHQGGRRYVFEINKEDPEVFHLMVERLTQAFGEAAQVRLFDALGKPGADEMERLRRRLEDRGGEGP